MVAGSGNDTRSQDWRLTLASRSAGRARHAKSLRCASYFLARPALREFWLVLTPKLDLFSHSDIMRTGCSGRCRNVPRIGTGLRRNGSHLGAADASGCRYPGERTERPKYTLAVLRIEIRASALTRFAGEGLS